MLLSASHLHSFIVANTPSHVMAALWQMDKAAMEKQHILFQEEDQAIYVRTMLERALS